MSNLEPIWKTILLKWIWPVYRFLKNWLLAGFYQSDCMDSPWSEPNLYSLWFGLLPIGPPVRCSPNNYAGASSFLGMDRHASMFNRRYYIVSTSNASMFNRRYYIVSTSNFRHCLLRQIRARPFSMLFTNKFWKYYLRWIHACVFYVYICDNHKFWKLLILKA